MPLENQVPNQEIDGPRAMLPLVPVREQQHHDVRQHAGLGHGQHDEMELENMLPLQQMVNFGQHDDMLEDGDSRPREQVMSPRERGHQQVNAVQDRQLAFANAPANVVAENRRREYHEHQQGGNVILEQRNILQQVIHQFQQPPQMEMILENQGNVLHQLVQEAHRVRQEVKDMKTAIVHALQTVDTNHAAHQQAIHAQGQSLHECHVKFQRLNVKQNALETAIGAVTEAQARLNEAMLSQERERTEKSETGRAGAVCNRQGE